MYSISAFAPSASATLVAISRTRFSARSRVCGRKLRTVPTSCTASGMTLNAPIWLVAIEQMLTTTASTGSTLRLAMVCSAVMMCAAATTGSTARCGHGAVAAACRAP